MSDIQRAREALAAIPCPSDRDRWWPIVGSALAEGLSQAEVLEWSERGPNFSRSSATATIKSLAGRASTGQKGSLFAIAREHGWNGRTYGSSRAESVSAEDRKSVV